MYINVYIYICILIYIYIHVHLSYLHLFAFLNVAAVSFYSFSNMRDHPAVVSDVARTTIDP